MSIAKIEASMMTTKRGYQTPRFFLEGTLLHLKEHLRYLGVELSRKGGSESTWRWQRQKPRLQCRPLSRLMPNTGGSKQRKRQLLMSVVQSQQLYAAPIWVSELEKAKYVRLCEEKYANGPQRRMALKIACAYKTVSINAILVVSGTLPLKLQAEEWCIIEKSKKMALKPTIEERIKRTLNP